MRWLAPLVAAAAALGSAPAGVGQRPLRVILGRDGPCMRLLEGSRRDAVTVPAGGLLLAGGGADQGAAFRWLAERAAGGDVVVLRASGSAAYNDYIASLAAVDSVETVIVRDPEDPCAAGAVRGAEAVFLAGGDQADVVSGWSGSSLVAAVERAREGGAVLGGTSAGTAVLGEIAFAALHGTVTSEVALADPYDRRVTLVRGFLSVPMLAGVVTDSHFAARDRMGRLVVFMARAAAVGWAAAPRGLGVDEATAVLVDGGGAATVVGRGAAYLVSASGAPERCEPGVPLAWRGLTVERVPAGGRFELGPWRGDGERYRLDVVDGRLAADRSGGAVY